VIALALLGGSLIATALIVGMISRPIRRAATGAAAIGTLDFDKVEPLPQSIFREISDLARSFNSMLDGLKAFGRYVPRTLVLRLIQEGRVGTRTEERKLAVMFTDIAGFTTACEDKSAVEVAEFINHHLALVSGCIEHESGTIDKYIGDAVMAFWGAPNRVENPAECACRAAIAIWRALSVDNAQRVDQGLKPIQVRIGIHFGPVVVGDIGAPNRINYTIVGDTVNAAQRLESLGKVVDPKAEVIVLISRQVMTALPNGFNLIDRGTHLVKGKHDAIEVFQLVGDSTRESENTIERR
jgi:adenylate cyclase